jgi:hypothetical protein
MSEPRRLLESSSAASRLLRTGLRDNPEPHAVRRAALVLGLGAASASAATGASALGASSGVVAASGTAAAGAAASSIGVTAVAAKWVVVGILSGTVAAGGASAIERWEPTSPRQEEPAGSQSQPAHGIELPKPRAQAAVSERSAEVGERPALSPVARDMPPKERRPAPTAAPAVAVRERTADAARATPRERGAQPNAPADDTGGLGRDLTQIDATRRALKAGDAQRAEALLDGYERGRRTDFFEREALVLRIEALVQQGQHQRAATLASSYFKRFPDDAHAPRIRSLLGVR